MSDSLLEEAKIHAKEHPSKDIRFFAGEVVKRLSKDSVKREVLDSKTITIIKYSNALARARVALNKAVKELEVGD